MKKPKNSLNIVGTIYIGIGVIICLFSLVFLLYPNLPYVLNILTINTVDNEIETLILPAEEVQASAPIVDSNQPEKELPPIIESYSKDNYIKIPSIGVNAKIFGGNNSELSLKSGTWIVPNYSTPQNKYLNPKALPIIIASHRYGYSDWSNEKRNLISFLHLPETKKGQEIIIFWNQRKYVYTITGGDENKYIKKGDFDLVLYTCKFYNSQIRIFRYAKLTSINGKPI